VFPFLIKILHAIDDIIETLQPIIQLLVEILITDWGSTSRVSGKLCIKVNTIRTGFHRQLLYPLRKWGESIFLKRLTEKMGLTMKLWCFFKVFSYESKKATLSSCCLFSWEYWSALHVKDSPRSNQRRPSVATRFFSVFSFSTKDSSVSERDLLAS